MSKLKVKHYLLLQAILSLVLPVFYLLSFSVSHGAGVMEVRVGFNAWVFFALIFAALAAAWLLRRSRE
ncbi:MAG: hypothetical protein IJL71_06355 [Oscillospiraceae bacterium]|nr:hypothetical protein [Oscillospiraceae bacterium]